MSDGIRADGSGRPRAKNNVGNKRHASNLVTLWAAREEGGVWWSAVHACKIPNYLPVVLRAWLRHPVGDIRRGTDRPAITLKAAAARSFVAWAQRLPGWSDSPIHISAGGYNGRAAARLLVRVGAVDAAGTFTDAEQST